jgi:hypothetical protein
LLFVSPAAPTVRVHPAAPTVRVHPAAPIYEFVYQFVFPILVGCGVLLWPLTEDVGGWWLKLNSLPGYNCLIKTTIRKLRLYKFILVTY